MLPRVDERTGGGKAGAANPVYVYGIVRSGTIERRSLEGIGDAAVETVAAGELAAIVSLLPSGALRVRRRDLVRHLHVLEAVFDETTIVPCAFGTVLPNEDAVRQDLLDARREELVDLLGRLDGSVQVNVKATYDEEIVLREVLGEEPEIRRLNERTRQVGDAGYFDRIRLGELVAAAVAARREHDAHDALERLSTHVEDVVVEEPGPDHVLRASFLLARDAFRRFDDELDALARERAPRLRFELIGPLPPTAFVSVARAERVR